MAEPESYSAVLHGHGLSVTRLRLAIMRVLHGDQGAASAADLLRQAAARGPLRPQDHRLPQPHRPGAGRAAAQGARRSHGPLRADVRPRPARAPALHCRRCNRFICLEPVDLSSVWGLLSQGDGLVPETAEITLVGLCKECAEGAEVEGSPSGAPPREANSCSCSCSFFYSYSFSAVLVVDLAVRQETRSRQGQSKSKSKQ